MKQLDNNNTKLNYGTENLDTIKSINNDNEDLRVSFIK